ncbi:Transmembrane protein 120 -like protein [Caligus rogercresseyi]|uniref:Transmembrane protein 120 -like protein n=1 Tax=Caligus rogercresseyi TaxID=217165 RepID=A0A7T8JVY2_CALRO|nr:Transmembrane protein 120 -like protein [Caligus rogercresseyi]
MCCTLKCAHLLFVGDVDHQSHYRMMDEISKDWNSLSKEFGELDIIHTDYLNHFTSTLGLQKRSKSGITHQRYRLQAMESELSQRSSISELRRDILRRYAQLSRMEDHLPRESGLYLKIILGNVNAKFNYKDQYEQFKLIIVLLGCFISVSNLYFNNRILDLLFMFLIVWYYCTLTIRESILKVNGSRIRGWWRAHHFLSTVMGGILLVWPDGECYQSFRPQLMYFNVYLALVQYMQFKYQRGCLYRLRSLGEQSAMDVTVEGFHSWMWKGMGFLLPFLYFGYIWQLYNACTLFYLRYLPSCSTWQSLFYAFSSRFWGRETYSRPPLRDIFPLQFTQFDKYFWNRRSSAASQDSDERSRKED